jgi:hypothetical protein
MPLRVSELARAHGPRAIEMLAELMNDPKATATARAMAAEKLLDRAYGRLVQITTTDTGESRRFRELSDQELEGIIAAALPVPTVPAEPDAEPPPLDPKKVN